MGVTDLHSIIFTVLAVLQVQVDEPDGEGMTFGGTPAPVETGMGQVSTGITWRLHPSQKHWVGQVREQEKLEKLETEEESRG